MTPEERRRLAEQLVAETHTEGGLAPLDTDAFWEDQAKAAADPFGADIPQVPLGIMMSGECVYNELGVPEDYWRYDHDAEWRLALNKAYNERSQAIVGRKLLGEAPDDPTRRTPWPKQLHDFFEARNVWQSESWWLMESAHNPDQLKALLDRVEERILPENIRSFMLPENWYAERERLSALGVKPGLYRHQRGPITFATSIYGVGNLIFLILDEPDLAMRFSDTILRAMLAIARVLDEEAGYTPDTAPHGFSFADDNCYLMTPDMYRLFGYPVLKGMFDRYSPNPGDSRYQHSDSAMAHLLPLLGSLGLTGVNFGPTVTVTEIREHLPKAVIYGQLAPYTFSRNEEVGIVEEFLRDFEMAREAKGLVFATAGSINNGSRLTGMRLIMSAIQRFGRY